MAQSWSEEEVTTTLDAYLDMLSLEQSGLPYVKSHVNKKLRDGPVSDRNRPSIEFRMRNISAVLEDLGPARIKGYVPAKNVGQTVRGQIVRLLDRRGFLDATAYEPTANLDELEKRSRELQKRGFVKPPKGTLEPKRTRSTRGAILRNPAVRAWVLYNAAGHCELCQKRAPFLDETGEPYLEVHHIIQLAGSGPDIVEYAVALCPNCHRRCHHAKDAKDARESMYGRLEG